MAINLNIDDLTISIVEKGESNTAYNVGGGAEIFKDKSGVTLNLRTLAGGTNISVAQNADTITINNDLTWNNVNGDITPDLTDTRSFGSPTLRWENAYFTGMNIVDAGTETQMLASQPLRIQSPNQQLIVDSGAADIVLNTDPSQKVWVPNNLQTGGDVLIGGNLTVNGSTTTVNSTVVTVDDVNITLADGATTPAEANGGGITIAGANAVLAYDSTGDQMTWNKTLFAPTLSANTLTATSGFFTNLDVSGNTTLGDAPADVVTINASTVQNADSFQYATGNFANILPHTDSTYEIGSSTNRWAGVWTDNAIVGSTTFTGTLDVNGAGVQSNLIPTANNTYALGSSPNHWSDVWTDYVHSGQIDGTGLYINGGATLTGDMNVNSNLFVNGSTVLGNDYIADTIVINGNTTINGPATVHYGLSSTGPLDVSNNVTVKDNIQFTDNVLKFGDQSYPAGSGFTASGYSADGVMIINNYVSDGTTQPYLSGISNGVTLSAEHSTGVSERIRGFNAELVIDTAGYNLPTGSTGRGLTNNVWTTAMGNSSATQSNIGQTTGQMTQIVQGNTTGVYHTDRLIGNLVGYFLPNAQTEIGDMYGFRYDRYGPTPNVTGTEYSFYGQAAGAKLYNNGPAEITGDLTVGGNLNATIAINNGLNVSDGGPTIFQANNNEVRTTGDFHGAWSVNTDGTGVTPQLQPGVGHSTVNGFGVTLNPTGLTDINGDPVINESSWSLDGQFYVNAMSGNYDNDSFLIDHGITLWGHNQLGLTIARDRLYYGKPQRHVTIPVGTTAPASPNEGEFWFDTTLGAGSEVLMTYRGATWIPVNSQDDGTMFFGSNGQFIVRIGGAWTALATTAII